MAVLFENTSKKIYDPRIFKVSCHETHTISNHEILPVCHALFNSEVEVAVGAAIVLGKSKNTIALPYLLRAFLTTNKVKGQAISWALGEIGHPSAQPFLISALRRNFIEEVVIDALGKIGTIDSLADLCQNTGNASDVIRALSARAIGKLNYGGDEDLAKSALTVLKKRLRVESSQRVRLVICVSCRNIDDKINRSTSL